MVNNTSQILALHICNKGNTEEIKNSLKCLFMFFQSRLSKCLVNSHLHFFWGGGGHATYNDGLQKDEAGSHSRKIWSEIYDRLMKRCYPIEGSVQLSSRWDLCAQKSPYGLHPDFQKFPLCYL